MDIDLTEAALDDALASMAKLEAQGIPVLLRPTEVTIMVAGERIRAGDPIASRDGKAYRAR